MPANYSMTWDAKYRRWQKMYRGVFYKVSCRKLGAPETKEASYQAANEWWRSKLAELNGDCLRWESAKQIIASQHAKIGESHANLLVALDHQRDLIAKLEKGEATASDLEAYAGNQAELVMGNSTAAPVDESVACQAKEYLAKKSDKVKLGELSLAQLDLIRRGLDFFVAWLEPHTSVKAINSKKWGAYWSYLSGLDCSKEYKRKRLYFAKAFVKWLATQEVIPMPMALTSEEYSFEVKPKKVPTFTLDEVKTLVDGSTGQLTLHLLLMLNCGFTQCDVADVVQEEVDWKAGTITRQRSKTRDHHPDSPTVTYKLWKRTFELLKQWRTEPGNAIVDDDGEEMDLVLRTKSGQRWMTRRETEGKFNRTDNTKSVYRHLQAWVGIKKPIKLLRKTSSSMLEDHLEYGRYALHFLADSPKGMAAKHYVKPSQKQFDAALEWLGQQYGKAVTG